MPTKIYAALKKQLNLVCAFEFFMCIMRNQHRCSCDNSLRIIFYQGLFNGGQQDAQEPLSGLLDILHDEFLDDRLRLFIIPLHRSQKSTLWSAKALSFIIYFLVSSNQR